MPKNRLPNQPDTQNSDYYKLELTQAVERVNSLENTRMQLGIFFGTANVTVLGAAFYLQRAGVLFVAAMVMLTFALIDKRFRALNIAYFYRALQLQKKLAPKDKETFLQLLPGDIATEAREIYELKNLEDRKDVLLRSRFSSRSIFFRLAISIAVGELVVGFLLWYIFKWAIA
jgi:hypothetical protein